MIDMFANNVVQFGQALVDHSVIWVYGYGFNKRLLHSRRGLIYGSFSTSLLTASLIEYAERI